MQNIKGILHNMKEHEIIKKIKYTNYENKSLDFKE